MTADAQNAAVIRRLNDIVNSGALDEMDALFLPGYVDHNPGWRISSVADLKRLIAGAREQFELHNVIEDLIAAGDRVVVRLSNHGRHVRAAFGVPPTGRSTTMQTVEIYRMEGGLIAERWVVSDVLSLLTQIGAPVPGVSP